MLAAYTGLKVKPTVDDDREAAGDCSGLVAVVRLNAAVPSMAALYDGGGSSEPVPGMLDAPNPVNAELVVVPVTVVASRDAKLVLAVLVGGVENCKLVTAAVLLPAGCVLACI